MKKTTAEFKTNINCGNCIRSVSGFLNDVSDIDHWEVDTDHPDKILKVHGLAPQKAIIDAVEDAGFDIEIKPIAEE